MKNNPFPSLTLKQLVIGYHHVRGTTPSELTAPIDAVWTEPGIHAIIGRNGMGKSTLIRTICGLQSPLSGEAQLLGRSVQAMSATLRSSWMSFVDSTPPRGSGLTTGQTLMLSKPNSSESDCRNWLNKLGNPNWWDKRLSELSDGQAQRVMVARAALQGAPWMILDEPTAFLDVPARTELLKLLDTMVQDGMGLLLTTHDLHLLERSSALASIHLLNADGLNALDANGRVKDWEIALSAQSESQNKWGSK